jgi:alginate O-acetyltransferase complex protein AlgI
MLIVWALTGLWHGASWNFVLWGLYFFVFLALEKYVYGKLLKKLPDIINKVLTFFIVVLGWVLFYFTDLSDVIRMYSNLFGAGGTPLIDTESRLLLINNLFLIIMCIVGATPLFSRIGQAILRRNRDEDRRAILSSVSILIANAALLVLCTISLVGSTHNPFIYFRF